MGEEKQNQAETDKPREIDASRMTQAQFLVWKRQKDADASAKKAEAARKRADEIAAGTVQMNGRELFLHEPWAVKISLKQLHHKFLDVFVSFELCYKVTFRAVQKCLSDRRYVCHEMPLNVLNGARLLKAAH